MASRRGHRVNDGTEIEREPQYQNEETDFDLGRRDIEVALSDASARSSRRKIRERLPLFITIAEHLVLLLTGFLFDLEYQQQKFGWRNTSSLMADSQVNIHKKNQVLLERKAHANRKNIISAAPIQPSQRITQKVMPEASTEAQHIDVPNPHKSDGISTNPGIHQCKPVTSIVMPFPGPDDGNRRFSHHTASSTNRLGAKNHNRYTHENLSQHKGQYPRLPQTARSLHSASSKDRLVSSHQTLISVRGSSMQRTSSSIKDQSHRVPSHHKANEVSPITKANSVPSPHQIVKAKLALKKVSRTSSQISESSVPDKHVKGCTETKDLTASCKRQSELCQDCRLSIMETVCFINNEGRITASLMNRLHYCKKPGCAANRSYYPPTSTPSKKAPVPKRQPPPTMQKIKYSKDKSHNFTILGDRPSACSSAASSIHQETDCDSKHQGLVQIKETCTTARISLDGDAESLLTSTNDAKTVPQIAVSYSPCEEEETLGGLVHSENLRWSITSRKDDESSQSNGENNVQVESSTLAGSCISFDTTHDQDGDDDGNHKIGLSDAINELHDFKSFCYHGDNEYSCSEDGTDATSTPNSLIKGAFENLSYIDVEEHQESKVSPSKKSPLAWMRHRYLESLREQEAERVRLRKQEIMARKQAGDWMLDCHMEELLHKLAPNGEARVKVLVEAFETVIHHSDSENSQTHHQEHNQIEDEQLDNMHSNTSSS
ncbi:hypothetical protein L7F22_031156 [Adiantum nelumboides]|nr:hypothetical protein [Adiantum nelumboides]